MTKQNARMCRVVTVLILILLLPSAFAHRPANGADSPSPDPWTKGQLITPQDYRSQLKTREGKPRVVCVGFEFMYKAAHIPGAIYIGPGRDAEGIQRLKNWAAGLSKDDPILLYCGCCPMKECPNLRPAFTALNGLNFTHLSVMDVPRDFARDWVNKGFPIEKGN